MMPKRIQRKRTKGWRMPEGAVYVGRPTKWGNPFYVGCYAKLGDGKHPMTYLTCAEARYASTNFVFIDSKEKAIEMFRELKRRYPLSEEKLRELRGKDLACWCPLGQPCHADVLLEIANS